MTKEQVLILNFSVQNLVYWVYSLVSGCSPDSSIFYFSTTFYFYFYACFSLSLSLFFPFYFMFSFTSLQLLRFIIAKYQSNIFSNCQRESKIYIPLPRLSPVGLNIQMQLGSTPSVTSEQQVLAFTGLDRMLTFFFISEFCHAIKGWNLFTKPILLTELLLAGLLTALLAFLGSLRQQNDKNCLMLYQQYSSSKSIMKVIGVTENIYIFLVSQKSCRFLMRLSLVVISSLYQK